MAPATASTSAGPEGFWFKWACESEGIWSEFPNGPGSSRRRLRSVSQSPPEVMAWLSRLRRERHFRFRSRLQQSFGYGVHFVIRATSAESVDTEKDDANVVCGIRPVELDAVQGRISRTEAAARIPCPELEVGERASVLLAFQDCHTFRNGQGYRRGSLLGGLTLLRPLDAFRHHRAQPGLVAPGKVVHRVSPEVYLNGRQVWLLSEKVVPPPVGHPVRSLHIPPDSMRGAGA